MNTKVSNRNNQKNNLAGNSGSVIIFLSLILMVLVVFVTVLLDMARISSAKAKAEDATSLGMNTAMSDYNHTLRDNYGLFTFQSDAAARAEDTVRKSIGAGRGMVSLDLTSFDMEIDGSSTLADYTAFRGQIIDEMKYLYTIPQVSNLSVYHTISEEPENYAYEKSCFYGNDRMISCMSAMLDFDRNLALLGETGCDSAALLPELSGLLDEWNQTIQADGLPDDFRAAMLVAFQEEENLLNSYSEPVEEPSPEVTATPEAPAAPDNPAEEAAGGTSIPQVVFSPDAEETEFRETLKTAGEWSEGMEDAFGSLTEGDSLFVAEYCVGFFTGKYNVRDTMLNGTGLTAIPHTRGEEERAYLLTGKDTGGVELYECAVDSILFTRNLFSLIIAGALSNGEFLQPATGSSDNPWACYYDRDMELMKYATLGETLQEKLQHARTIDLGCAGSASNNMPFTAETLEVLFFARELSLHERELMNRMRVVIEENMQAAGYAGFRFASAGTKMTLRASFTTETVFRNVFGADHYTGNFTIERKAGYR